jgi:excisionase family DNA binding protein
MKKKKRSPILAPPPSSLDILTETEAASLLSLEPRTLRVWRAKRAIPFLRITAKVIRYRRSDIDGWLLRHRVAVAA